MLGNQQHLRYAMFNKSSIFRTTCLLCVAVIFVLGLFPLATTALRSPVDPQTEAAVTAVPLSGPAAAPDSEPDEPAVDMLC